MSNYITAEGLEKLKKQLEETKQKLKEVSVKIKEAREMGDLSENAEYHEAKNEQAFMMGKEQEIEQKIKNAQIIKDNCTSELVQVGCTVEIEQDKEKVKYRIVGSDEADPISGLISVDSPIGSALIGHKKGDAVKVKTPAGVAVCKILSIN